MLVKTLYVIVFLRLSLNTGPLSSFKYAMAISSLTTDCHGLGVCARNIRRSEALVHSHHAIEGNLPHSEEGEDESEEFPDVKDDEADNPVDKVGDPLS